MNEEYNAEYIKKAGVSRVGKTQLIKFLKGETITRAAAIKAKCYDCNGLGEINTCDDKRCPLWPYSPYKIKG